MYVSKILKEYIHEKVLELHVFTTVQYYLKVH